jgi:hypothetical protein
MHREVKLGCAGHAGGAQKAQRAAQEQEAWKKGRGQHRSKRHGRKAEGTQGAAQGTQRAFSTVNLGKQCAQGSTGLQGHRRAHRRDVRQQGNRTSVSSVLSLSKRGMRNEPR